MQFFMYSKSNLSKDVARIIRITIGKAFYTSYFIIYMQRKSLDNIDFFLNKEQNQQTNEQIQPSNINVFSSMGYCSALHLQDSTRECRICLQQIQDVEHNFISPCKCTGSLKFVHESCFIMWLDRLYNSKSSTQQKIMKAAGLPCQICKEKVYLTFKDKSFCLSEDEIKRKISNNLLIFVVLIFFLVILFGSMCFVISFIHKTQSSFRTDIISSTIVICALAFLITASTLTLYYLTTRFFMQSRSTLSSFELQKITPKSNNKRKIMPTSLC